MAFVHTHSHTDSVQIIIFNNSNNDDDTKNNNSWVIGNILIQYIEVIIYEHYYDVL